MKKRHSAEQIVAKLRQADVDLGKGLTVPEVCKQMGISDLPYRTLLTKPPAPEYRTAFLDRCGGFCQFCQCQTPRISAEEDFILTLS